jgi:uncharacterized protein YciI
VLRPLLGLGLLLGGPASLFGAIPPILKAIVPENGAVGVPTDTTVTLEVAGTAMDPQIRLFEAGTEVEVPGKTEERDRWKRSTGPSPRPAGWVGGEESGARYVFRPGSRLKPRTRYEVRCGLWLPQGACPSFFTTGAAAASKAAVRETPPPAAASQLFAILFRTGPAWDRAKAPGEQSHFKEHSANIARLEGEGRLVVGGRFSELGLLLVRAASREEAQSWVDRDPAVAAGVFMAEVHPWSTFAAGCLE